MLPQTARRLSQAGLSKDAGRVWARGGPRRQLSLSRCLSKAKPPLRTLETRVEIPGLQMVTYGDRMHYVPGLTKPTYPPWERAYKDPRYYKSPPAHDMPLYKEKVCHVYNQKTSPLEGVLQALWLTKSILVTDLPSSLKSLLHNPEIYIPNQDERIRDAIKSVRFWDTTESRPDRETYSKNLLSKLLYLCATQQYKYPAIGRRILTEKYSLAASWTRGEDLFQVRGQNGVLLNCMDPLPEVFGKQEVADTAEQALVTFYPISPTIDLQQVYVYKEEANCTGFREGNPYPHAHTLFFLEDADHKCKLRKEQFRAKMVMFAFGNALARARRLYGMEPQVLDRPITVQAIGSNGRRFQFLVLQLNTTDLSGDDGIKNQVWLEENLLYDFAKVRPLIRKRELKVPAGLAGYKPATFRKFLALYLHGAV